MMMMMMGDKTKKKGKKKGNMPSQYFLSGADYCFCSVRVYCL